MAASLAIGLIVADPLPAQTQAASDAPTVEELLREIEQLRRRVETLERQVGATAAEPPPAAQEEERDEAAAPAGPPPAEIGAIEATEEQAERALERALVQTGALLLPAGTAEIEPSFSYSRQEEDAPVFVSEGGEQSLAAGKARSDSLEARPRLACRPAPRLAASSRRPLPLRGRLDRDADGSRRAARGEPQ